MKIQFKIMQVSEVTTEVGLVGWLIKGQRADGEAAPQHKERGPVLSSTGAFSLYITGAACPHRLNDLVELDFNP